MNAKVKITLSDPVHIAQATPDIRHWGPYQFPTLDRMPDGALHCRYHVELDSAASYGKDGGHALSYDNGRTWQPAPPRTAGGLLLPNGDRIKGAGKAAIRATADELPKEIIAEAVLNTTRIPLYDPDCIPYEYSGRYLLRQKAGTTEWVEERHDIHIPFEVRYTTRGLLPYPGFTRLRLAPDGTLWMICYPYTYKDKRSGMAAAFVVSHDNGYTWHYKSSIYYTPDPSKDFYWALRTGYTEPDIAFLPDGSLMCLLRTDDSFHRGPSYCSYSTDGGSTWSKPEVFDDRGVWPCFLTLANGITLLGYGRYGLFLRATADPAGREWDDRLAIVAPDGDYENTCAYCDLYPLSGDTAYLVYSYFDEPNADGAKCKTILGRTVKAELI